MSKHRFPAETYTFDAEPSGEYVTITARDHNGVRVGMSTFLVCDSHIEADNVIVYMEHHRRGIASGMYDAAEQAGKTARPSKDLSEDARLFWKSRSGRRRAL